MYRNDSQQLQNPYISHKGTYLGAEVPQGLTQMFIYPGPMSLFY